MDFGNTKYYNQKKRVITLRKGKGAQAGYVTMNGAKIVSRRPTIYYIMNNGAIRALSNANTGAIPSALKYKVLKGKAPAKPKNVGNAAALNAVKAKRVAGLVKARQVKATKGAFRALPGYNNNQGLFNNNLAKKANKKLATRGKKLAALTKARQVKATKGAFLALPGYGNNRAANNSFNLPNPLGEGMRRMRKNAGIKRGPRKAAAAVHAANKTAEKVNKIEGVNNTTANAAVNAAAAAAKAVTPTNAGATQAANIANAASAGATSAVQALPVNERSNKNAVAAAAAAGASQAANAAKNGNSTPSESKNIGAAAGTAVTNAKKLKVN